MALADGCLVGVNPNRPVLYTVVLALDYAIPVYLLTLLKRNWTRSYEEWFFVFCVNLTMINSRSEILAFKIPIVSEIIGTFAHDRWTVVAIILLSRRLRLVAATFSCLNSTVH